MPKIIAVFCFVLNFYLFVGNVTISESTSISSPMAVDVPTPTHKERETAKPIHNPIHSMAVLL